MNFLILAQYHHCNQGISRISLTLGKRRIKHIKHQWINMCTWNGNYVYVWSFKCKQFKSYLSSIGLCVERHCRYSFLQVKRYKIWLNMITVNKVTIVITCIITDLFYLQLMNTHSEILLQFNLYLCIFSFISAYFSPYNMMRGCFLQLLEVEHIVKECQVMLSF